MFTEQIVINRLNKTNNKVSNNLILILVTYKQQVGIAPETTVLINALSPGNMVYYYTCLQGQQAVVIYKCNVVAILLYLCKKKKLSLLFNLISYNQVSQ